MSNLRGTLDGETGLPPTSRICIADRGDYCTHTPAVPSFMQAAEHPRACAEIDRG